MVSFKNKEFYIDYEADMDRGYGVESTSDQLYLSFNSVGDLEEAVLYGLHFTTELDFEIEYDISTEKAKQLVKDYIIEQGVLS